MSRYLVGVYWGAREEPRESCANRISQLLKALAAHTTAFSQWFKEAKSRKSKLVAWPQSSIEIASLLTTINRDIDDEPFIDMGFHFFAWTGRTPGIPASFEIPETFNIKASLSISCGIYSTVVCNSAVLSFTPPEPPAIQLLQGLLKAAVAAFDPDDGVVHSDDTLKAQPGLSVCDSPALFRYKRGIGFTGGEVEYNPATENVMV